MTTMTSDRQLDNPPDGGIEMTRARGAQRVGFIWILLISMALAWMALFGYWAIDSHHLATAREGPKAPAAAFTATPPPALGVGPVR